MIPISLDDLRLSHLEQLVSWGAIESRVLEFKSELPGRADRDKNEFLADVSAFANASGGDLIYGIEENDTGVASNIRGCAVNPDDECLRLQDIILNGLEPRLAGVNVKPVEISAGAYAIVLRIPRSWTPPHRVRGNNHFYIREAARKRPLDIAEIRSAFIQSDSLKRRIQDFRIDRTGRILSGETPVQLVDGVVELMHIVPLVGLAEGDSLNISPYVNGRTFPVLNPASGSTWRINLDGILRSGPFNDGCNTYTQFFRNYWMEGVRVFNRPAMNSQTHINIPSRAFEDEIIQFVTSVVAEYSFLEMTPPFVMMYTLVRANRARLGIGMERQAYLSSDQGTFDRSVINVPEIVFEEWGPNVAKNLKPLFDLIWNAAGLPSSFNYSDDGARLPPS